MRPKNPIKVSPDDLGDVSIWTENSYTIFTKCTQHIFINGHIGLGHIVMGNRPQTEHESAGCIYQLAMLPARSREQYINKSNVMEHTTGISYLSGIRQHRTLYFDIKFTRPIFI